MRVCACARAARRAAMEPISSSEVFGSKQNKSRAGLCVIWSDMLSRDVQSLVSSLTPPVLFGITRSLNVLKISHCELMVVNFRLRS